MTTGQASAIDEGRVRHRRAGPGGHAFRYRLALLHLDPAERRLLCVLVLGVIVDSLWTRGDLVAIGLTWAVLTAVMLGRTGRLRDGARPG